MKIKGIQKVWRTTLSFLLSAAILNLSVLSAGAESPSPSADPGLSSVNVKLNEVDFKKVLSVDIGLLASGLSPQDDNYTCKKAALLVAQAGADKYGYWNTFMDLLAQTAKGLQIGATLGGQPTVAKLAEVAGTIVEAFDSDDPAAALGQALINESVGWAASQAKTGNDAVDGAIKDAATKAKDKLIQQLFPGTPQKAKTYDTTVGTCSVHITPEFQWPGQGPGQVGGLRLYVSGTCDCTKPLDLGPFNFNGADVRKCGLSEFSFVAFMPLKRFDTSLSFGGTPIDLTKLLGTASKLKQAISDALAGKEPTKVRRILPRNSKAKCKRAPTSAQQ